MSVRNQIYDVISLISSPQWKLIFNNKLQVNVIHTGVNVTATLGPDLDMYMLAYHLLSRFGIVLKTFRMIFKSDKIEEIEV